MQLSGVDGRLRCYEGYAVICSVFVSGGRSEVNWFENQRMIMELRSCAANLSIIKFYWFFYVFFVFLDCCIS